MRTLQMGVMLLAAVLAGCATENPTYPEPKMTDDVREVMAMKDAGRGTPETATLEGLFKTYTGCMPSGRVWEEMEPGVIFFTCRAPAGGMVQFIWKAKGEAEKRHFVLNEVVITNMADQEWSALNYRGKEAEAMLERVRRNEPVSK